MAYQELVILLPCHSLEDFPTHHEGEEAQGLLACWTTLWHPALIASAGKAPTWARVDDPPQEVAGQLIAVPGISRERLPTGYAQRVKEGGGVLLRNMHKREELVAAALGPLGGSTLAGDIVGDFYALGYAFLMVQLLTRQMRYSSSLDDVYFKSQAVVAAQAIAAGDEAACRERLSACFSLLAEERDRYYPVDAYLLDLTILAETTLGVALREQLQSGNVSNLLLDGQLLERMESREPESLTMLAEAVRREQAGVLGGDDVARRSPLLSLEEIAAGLRCGSDAIQQRLGVRPSVYGRRRFGLSPALPQVLLKSGFVAALHATLEDGRFPEGTQLKVSWEGSDGTSLPAIARPPLDAAQAKTFLQLATKLGESMDQDHVATLNFAHWPGQTSEFYDDLRRTTSYSSCLGRFATIEQYFHDSAAPGQMDRFTADRYKSPYLKQSVIRRQPDPISSIARYWQRRATWEAIEAMYALRSLVTGKLSAPPSEVLARIVDQPETANDPSLDERLSSLREEAAQQLATAICPQSATTSGCLTLNPYACVRRTGVDHVALPHLAEAANPVYAVGQQDDRKHAVVDVPAFGFAWIAGAREQARSRKAPVILAEAPNLLRNEFFEVLINTTTGAVQSLHEYSSRRNRLSQQLALRTPGPPGKPGDVYRDPDETALYSIMAADAVEITCATPAMGEITVQGRLMDREGKTQAEYRQQFRVWKGSRVLQIEIELDPREELKSDPWNSYYGCRFAWGDEAALLARTVHQQRHETTTKYLEAPHYIEIDHADKRTTVLTAGLPYHRRTGPAMLDSLMIVRGETARKFKLGIGIDLQHPMHEAMAMLAPPLPVVIAAQPPKTGPSGWLVHLDSRNVITTHLSPLERDGRVVGFRARVLETAGRPATLTVSALRSIGTARKVDFRGNVLNECSVEAGKAKLNMSAHEWAELEAYW
jgi:alpha-mannosidase